MTDSDESVVREAIAAERREMAAVLEALPEPQWDAPTLCEGWRVREVAAHMTMPFRTTLPRVMFEVVKSRGNFHRMADRAARRDAAALSARDLAASMRDNAGHPWKPPGGGSAGALAHDVIHGLDITVPLGLDRRPPVERISLVLGGLQPRNVTYFGADLRGVQLRADDLDWSYGAGTPLTGLAQDLLLVLCGRKLPAGQVQGERSVRFTRA